MCAKNAGLDASVAPAGRLHQSFEQLPSLARRSGGREARSQALVGIRGQGKLGHQQQIPLDLLQALIHFSVLVREYPVLKQTVDQPQGGCFVVGWAHPDQHQEPGAYGCNALGADVDTGFYNALQQSDHGVSLHFAAAGRWPYFLDPTEVPF
jgi:hypothetical protein